MSIAWLVNWSIADMPPMGTARAGEDTMTAKHAANNTADREARMVSPELVIRRSEPS